MGNLANIVDAIYIPRSGNEEQRKKIIKTITDRQDSIEESGKYAPLLIFPEGGTTNGTSCLKFKKGAFIAQKRIQPYVLQYSTDTTVSPAFDVIQVLALFIFTLSWSCLSCKVLKLPEVYPTEFMFQREEAKGLEPWEAYANVCREIMCKAGNLKPCDISLREKKHYEGFMQKIKKYPTPYIAENEQ